MLGDIDPEFNVVEVTEEAKQELAKIENKVDQKFFVYSNKIAVYLEYEFQT